MTRKDYQALAKALSAARPTISTYGFEQLCKALARHCLLHNPAFNRPKFFEACGLVEWTEDEVSQ